MTALVYLCGMKLFKRSDRADAPYYARFQVKGRAYLWSTKTADLFVAKKRAKTYREAVVANAYQVIGPMKARGIGPTFADLFADYLTFPSPGARTRRDNVAALKAILAACGLNNMASLDQVGAGMATQWQKEATKMGKPATTVNTVLRSARSLFSKRAMIHYKPDTRPHADRVRELFSVPMLKEPEKRPELPMQGADEKAAIDLPARNPAAYRAYLLARYAGLRAGEIKAARRDWLEGDVLFVGGREFVAKSRKWRPIALPHEVVVRLSAAPGTSPTDSLVGEPVKQVVNRQLPALLHEYGFPKDKPLHALRRLYGSIVYTFQGPRQARDALGHSTQAVTDKHYARSLDAPLPIAFAG